MSEFPSQTEKESEEVRDIKFRAWDKINLKMKFIDGLFFDSLRANFGMAGNLMTVTLIGQDKKLLTSLDDLELMQFTGLHDKNGKEIFQDDLVSYEGVIKQIKKEWTEFSGYYFTWGSTYLTHIPTNFKSTCEVFGNVWESPELLK